MAVVMEGAAEAARQKDSKSSGPCIRMTSWSSLQTRNTSTRPSPSSCPPSILHAHALVSSALTSLHPNDSVLDAFLEFQYLPFT